MTVVHVRVKSIEDKIEEYVDTHCEEIYVDYSDELSSGQVDKILAGKAEEVRDEIEEADYAYATRESTNYYWEQCMEETGASQDDIDDWLDNDGYYPAFTLTDYDFRRLMRNTDVYITATVWDADWNFGNWAYGGPVDYKDVKESLKIMGINPKEFRDLNHGTSMSGKNSLRGWFPDMPNRIAKVDIKALAPQSLYDGVMNFCLGDLEQIYDVLNENTKDVTFTKGTNIVMYNFTNGAGITEVELEENITIPRKKIEFRNDGEDTYGIQACYGFVHSFWNEGGIRSGK